jgi:hypothetical protein
MLLDIFGDIFDVLGAAMMTKYTFYQVVYILNVFGWNFNVYLFKSLLFGEHPLMYL